MHTVEIDVEVIRTMTPKRRGDLDRLNCEEPGCTHAAHKHDPLVLELHGHEDMGADVTYLDGVLYLTCTICGSPVEAIAVAE